MDSAEARLKAWASGAGATVASSDTPVTVPVRSHHETRKQRAMREFEELQARGRTKKALALRAELRRQSAQDRERELARDDAAWRMFISVK